MMVEGEVKKSAECYAAIISCAEKNDKWEDAIKFLDYMRDEGDTFCLHTLSLYITRNVGA